MEVEASHDHIFTVENTVNIWGGVGKWGGGEMKFYPFDLKYHVYVGRHSTI